MNLLGTSLLVLSSATLAACVSAPATTVDPGGSARESIERDLRYTPADWPQALSADLHRPAGRGPFPAVILVHGGGWDSRDRSDMERLSRRLAQNGYVALNIDYRLAPEHLYPAAVDDVRAALRWLQSNAQHLDVDTRRIGGWGYSAGAQLVALVAVRGRPDHPPLAAVVAGGMPADFARYPRSPIISRFIGASYAQAPERWTEASPIAHIDADAPPMFLYHGSWDRLVEFEDSAAMKRALDGASVTAELYAVRFLGHITTFVLGSGARGAAMAFLDRHLAARPAAAD